jgi:hypothetical protein
LVIVAKKQSCTAYLAYFINLNFLPYFFYPAKEEVAKKKGVGQRTIIKFEISAKLPTKIRFQL